MDMNRKTLFYSLLAGLIISVINGVILYLEFRDYNYPDLSFMIILILLIVVAFMSIVYWMYREIEYRKKKWGEIKRPWYSWIWWPSKKWEERVYWNQLIRLTYTIPFLVYFWIVFIGNYSVNIGLFSAILSFIISLFIISRVHHWLEKPKSIEEIIKVTIWKKIKLSAIIAVVAEIILFGPVFFIQMTREDASEVTIGDLGDFLMIFFFVFLFFFSLAFLGIWDYYNKKQQPVQQLNQQPYQPTTYTSVKYCGNCGIQTNMNSRFCSKCGYKF